MIIAIDGPAGAGKSTVARGVAARLGFAFLDTGALYRATALAVMRTGRPPARVAAALDSQLGQRILLEGEDVTAAIRTPEVTDLTHRIAADPLVRQALTEKQRAMIHRGDWVAEGRDIGTVVAPDAALKIFLTASLQERARRRAAEHGGDVDEIMRQLAERDARDEAREHSPLVAAEDAIQIDTSRLTADEVIDQIIALVPGAENGAPALFALTPEDAIRRRRRSDARDKGRRRRPGIDPAR